MNNWFNFIAFGFCLGMAVTSFLNKDWGTGIIQILISCINIPFMVTNR